MNRSLKQSVCTLLLLLCGAAAWGQDDFNPTNPPDPYMLYKVVATATEGNYTSGSGQYLAGTRVTLNTSAQSTIYTFRYWTKNGEQYTTDRQFTYTVEAENVRFVAVYEFNPDNPADPQAINERRLYLVPQPEGACSFNRTSGAKAKAGTSILVTANASQGYDFVGWYVGDEEVSTSRSFNYTMPDANTTLTARFNYNPVNPGDPESSMTEEDWLQKGDVNGDGDVSVADIMAIYAYMLENNPPVFNEKAADLNKDGEIDIADVFMLINLILNQE